MKKILALFFLVLSLNFSAQLSEDIYKLIVSYEKLNKNPFKLDVNEYSSQKQRVEKKLRAKISKQELETIYKDDYNYYTKSFVIQEFLRQGDKTSLVKLFKETIIDKDSVLFNNHPLYDSQMGFLIINSELFENLVMDSVAFEIKDSPLKEELIDFIFASSPINIQLLENIQFQIPLRQKYYDELKKLVIDQKSKKLLFGVARFKNRDDIALIKTFGIDSFQMIIDFPDAEFIPFLDSFVEKEYYNPDFLKCISSFCNNEAEDIITKLNSIYDARNDKFNKELLQHYLSVKDCKE